MYHIRYAITYSSLDSRWQSWVHTPTPSLSADAGRSTAPWEGESALQSDESTWRWQTPVPSRAGAQFENVESCRRKGNLKGLDTFGNCQRTFGNCQRTVFSLTHMHKKTNLWNWSAIDRLNWFGWKYSKDMPIQQEKRQWNKINQNRTQDRNTANN